jgi:hypothetical protein
MDSDHRRKYGYILAEGIELGPDRQKDREYGIYQHPDKLIYIDSVTKLKNNIIIIDTYLSKNI